MKRFIAALAVSVWLHILVVAFFLWYRLPAARQFGDIQMEFVAPEPMAAPTFIPATVPIDRQRPILALPPTSANSAPANLILAAKDTTLSSPEEQLSALKLPLASPRAIIKAYAVRQNYDSLVLALQPPQYWQPDARTNRSLAQLPLKSSDPIAAYLHKKNIGQVPTGNLLPLLSALKFEKQEPKAPPRLESVPTRVQLQALKVLWQSQQATLSEIYASMDSSFIITAQILDQVLQDMCEKNLLERKKISPSNEFTLIGPFLEHGIEMNELNRKNPVYEYRARIKRDEVIRFLQARLYLLNESQPSESEDLTQKAAADIMARIQQILSSSADMP